VPVGGPFGVDPAGAERRVPRVYDRHHQRHVEDVRGPLPEQQGVLAGLAAVDADDHRSGL
jgi:hypothetical protein